MKELLYDMMHSNPPRAKNSPVLVYANTGEYAVERHRTIFIFFVLLAFYDRLLQSGSLVGKTSFQSAKLA